MNIDNLLHAFLYLLIFGAIIGILFWVIRAVGLPEPFAKIARLVLIVISAVVCVDFLLGFVGHSFIHWR